LVIHKIWREDKNINNKKTRKKERGGEGEREIGRKAEGKQRCLPIFPILN
jgi:hypothetical protein